VGVRPQNGLQESLEFHSVTIAHPVDHRAELVVPDVVAQQETYNPTGRILRTPRQEVRVIRLPGDLRRGVGGAHGLNRLP